ncbi:serine/threonine-protein kinase [uncultured Nocardioides sp.]|uniref:serine/threonine-protein kinase n=1 Tax=uncultured Nocardioides sp. TaxID=198441 RepID=UPI000C477434|nr:serine/threonine-protein kinase [uncultured Nocardioides sp.]MAO82149.1 serine/threonine protein kinase [Nocardioides sp.]
MIPRPRSRATPDRLVGGRYLLGEHLGTGGMGSVWRATDRRSGEEVALKVLGQHDPGSAALVRFVREQAVRVRHPHVLAPVGWVAEDERVALATRLVRGGTVEDLLAEHGPLPTTYAAALLDQLLDALSAVHRAGVVHRDVKPANLLLEPTGTGRPRLLLADFGISVVAGDSRLTRVPGPVGTDGFVPPELAGGGPATPSQDLYAAGVVGTLLLTGAGPTAPVPPGPLAPLLTALRHPDPAARPPDARTARTALRDLHLPPGPPWSREHPVPDVRDRLTPPSRRASRFPGPVLGPVLLPVLVLMLATVLSVLALLVRG